MSTPIDPKTTYTITEEQLQQMEELVGSTIVSEIIKKVRYQQRVVPPPKPSEFNWQQHQSALQHQPPPKGNGQ